MAFAVDFVIIVNHNLGLTCTGFMMLALLQILVTLTRYESCLDSGCGSHWNLTSPVSASVLWRRFWTGRGRVVTLPVAGHEATFPDTVLTTT